MKSIVTVIFKILVMTAIFAIVITAAYFMLPKPGGMLVGAVLFIIYDLLFMAIIDKAKKSEK